MIKYTSVILSSLVNGTMSKCHMNLAFPFIWEQDKYGSSYPIGIGALDVKFFYFD